MEDETVIRQLLATIQHVLHCYSIIENELTGVKEMPVTMKDLESRHAHLLARARQYTDVVPWLYDRLGNRVCVLEQIRSEALRQWPWLAEKEKTNG
jgi:hypothetical protein